MKSPFPGMDPYLEARWADVHQRLITYAADEIGARLPADLRARVEERVYVQTEAEQVRQIIPDVHIAQYHPASAGQSGSSGSVGVALAEPLLFMLEEDPVTEGFIEIRETGGSKVITVIEFLSPANKSGGEGQNVYLQKQREVLRSDTNLVEIDLLRSGQRVFAFPANRIPENRKADFVVCTRCTWAEHARDLFLLPLRERLPTIPLPLRQGDPVLPLDLQALLDRCYHNGRYDDIDYAKPAVPRLEPDDAEWADQVLKTAGKR